MRIHFEDNKNEISAIIASYEKNLKENIARYFDVDDYLTLVDHYMLSSKIKRANMALETGLSQHPYSLDLKLKEAELLTMQNRHSEALTIIDFLEPLRNDTDLYLLKGIVLNTLNKSKDANKAFHKAIELEEDIEELYELYFKIGLSFQHIIKYKEALRYHKKLFELAPTHKENTFELAYCYEQLNLLSQSVKFYDKYLDENPYSEKVWYNMGIIHNKLQQYEEAIKAYDFALAISPNNKDALFNKGNAFFYQQKYDKSLSCYLQCLNFPDDHSFTHTYIGECYEKKGEFQSATLHYNKAIEIDEDLAEAWFGLGMVAKLQLHFGKAIFYMEQSIKKDNSYGESHLELGKIYETIGEKTLALSAYKYAALINPQVWYYLLELVTFYHRENKTDIALKLLEENIDIFNEEAEFHFYSSLFSLLLEKKDNAITHLKKGLSLDKEQFDSVLNYCKEYSHIIDKNKFNELQNLL